MFCLNSAAAMSEGPSLPGRQARKAGSTPAGGGPQGKNRTKRCFA
jgi:hypothetical protein